MSKRKKQVMLVGDTLANTYQWFVLAHPAPTSKQMHTQTGVHFEEVGEMIDEIVPLNAEADVLLHNAKVAIKALGTFLKKHDNVICIPPENKPNYLDALCDQIVTATGVGRDLGFQMVEALQEVNESNWSKFVDGKPIFDENGKIMKGPDHFKPDLSAFIPAE